MTEDSRPSPRQERINEAVAALLASESSGADIDRDRWLAAYADVAGDLAAFLAQHDQMKRVAQWERSGRPDERRIVKEPTRAAEASVFGPELIHEFWDVAIGIA